MGDNASSSDEEPGQLAMESDYDGSDMRIERDDGISRVETGKEKQLQDGRSTLDRVLSRTSAADKDPGPPPDGGFWAWASGNCLLLPDQAKYNTDLVSYRWTYYDAELMV